MNLKSISYVVLVAIIMFSSVRMLMASKPGSQLTRQFVNKAVVIDVRSEAEYEQSHFKGAVNIPLDQIEASIERIKQFKKPIVVYCRSGNRSSKAQAVLKQQGVNVVNGINQTTLESLK